MTQSTNITSSNPHPNKASITPEPAPSPTSLITSLPPSFHYISDFLPAPLQSQLLASLPPNRWISLSHRRLQAHPSPLSKSDALLDAPLPKWMDPVLSRLEAARVFEAAGKGNARPNHCLVNEYRAGEGIMAHEDGAAYEGCVATVSLGCGIVLDIWSKGGSGGSDSDDSGRRLMGRIYQEPGSLLVTSGEAYTELLHGIGAVEEDVDMSVDGIANWALLSDETRTAIEEGGGRMRRGTRTSLTFRQVKKVRRIGIGIVGRR